MKAKIELTEGATLQRAGGQRYENGRPIISTDPEEIAYCKNNPRFRVTPMGKPAKMKAKAEAEALAKAQSEAAKATPALPESEPPPPPPKPSRPRKRTIKKKAVARTEED